MTPDPSKYKHADLTGRIIKVFYAVYNELGHGFIESVYEKAMMIALAQEGLRAVRQQGLRVYFRGQAVGEFDYDILVEGLVLLELKAVRKLDAAHEAQLLHYLRASDVEVGLLLNFGESPQIKRMVYDNARKRHRGAPTQAQDLDII